MMVSAAVLQRGQITSLSEADSGTVSSVLLREHKDNVSVHNLKVFVGSASTVTVRCIDANCAHVSFVFILYELK
jgi:hypothetical protein